MRIRLLLIGAVLIAACRPRVQPAATASEQTLVGAWQAQSARVALNFTTQPKYQDLPATSANAGRSLTVFEVTGTLREERWSASDSLLGLKKGFWHQHADSLYFHYEGQEAQRNAFGLRYEDGGRKLILSGRIDFDADGSRDDVLELVLRR